MRNQPQANRRAFTMIELLVVVGMLGVLASILFPVFAQGKEAARKTACLSNLKQWGLGFNMYLADNDDVFPNQEWSDADTEDQNGDISWIDVVEPYAEETSNINALGAAMNNQDGLSGKTRLNVCPSQTSDPRAGMYADGTPRPYKAGVKQSYGMSEWSVGAWRPFGIFPNPTGTALLSENFLNYNQTLFYPVDTDGYDADEAGFAQAKANDPTDCRFDRGVDCQNSAGFFPANPHAMPGIAEPFASNLGNRHNKRNVVCFVDGHVKAMLNRSTYRDDGSRSIWTISNTWLRH